MPIIAEISLRNFRGFESLKRLRLAPLTFLVGPNSSGKSSIADAVLLLSQSGLLSLQATKPIWNGPLVDLGSFQDTVYRHEVDRVMEVDVRMRDIASLRVKGKGPSERRGLTVNVAASLRAGEEPTEGRLSRLTIKEKSEAFSAGLVRVRSKHPKFRVRIGAHEERYVPQMWLPPIDVLRMSVGHDDSPRLRRVLQSGSLELLAESIQRVSSGRDSPRRFYERATSGDVGRARRLLSGVDPEGIELGKAAMKKALEKGLSTLDIANDFTATRLSDYHSAIKLTDNRTGVRSNLADFGYGTSQVLPVLEGCASPGPGPLFVEQPEIHLHPRAQGHLAQILCETSRKRQVIVETHSEHMVNRARRLVAEGEMRAKDVVIQYIDRGPQGSHAVTIDLDDAGDFTRDWPDGFYDERYIETMKIAEAQAKRAAE